jgi:ubiquinone/menaquinone biosynthesis C-methylase UbiE
MPTKFIADLRHPVEDKEHPEDKWSQWSSLPMIELSALDTYQFVKAMVPSQAQKILEIGCGNGYLTLELARDGHEVIGLDRSNDIIEVAERTRAAHPATPGFGKLTYVSADFGLWESVDASFDLVVINRTLHHLTDLGPMLAKVKHLLTSQGSIICQDYAYDRLNDQAASWMYAMQRLLFLSGLADEDPATADDEEHSIEVGREAWLKRAEEHHLNRFEEMSLTLRTAFHEQVFAWVPYLFVYIGNRIRHATPEQERALIPFLKQMEQYQITKGHMQAVGFRFVGSV